MQTTTLLRYLVLRLLYQLVICLTVFVHTPTRNQTQTHYTYLSDLGALGGIAAGGASTGSRLEGPEELIVTASKGGGAFGALIGRRRSTQSLTGSLAPGGIAGDVVARFRV